MNVIFYVVFILSNTLLLFIAPQDFLPTLLLGASKSATLCLSLLSTYCVWLGLMRVWEDSGVSKKLSHFLKPLSKKLFKTDDEKTLQAVTMSLSVNLLGISGAATPYGIQAAALLDKTEHAEYASCMLFALNATSLQLIPTSVIGVRVALRSVSPADILFPTLLTSIFSTVLAAILVRVFIPPKTNANKVNFFTNKNGFTVKTKGAGTQ